MGYEPYPRQGRDEIWGTRDSEASQRYGYGYDPDRDRYRSSAREYAAAGQLDRGRESWRDRDYYGSRFGRDDDSDWNRGSNARGAGSYRGYGSSYGGYDEGRRAGGRRDFGRDYERRPEGYAYQDRDFFSRAGDEVRSWFGDEEAERRRAADARYDERYGSRWSRDDDYHGWRRRQIEDLDRDYDEYRRENATRFENEFGSWRNERQTQRGSLQRVTEHMEVLGSDGQHVGTVDKVRGDRIILTKSDPDAGGHHHSIPSRWIEAVDDKVTIRKSADEAKAAWRDEERSGALFGERDDTRGAHYLNRSFSGTY
ncbi:DUF2171 domain-containing protein [Sphingomonas sp. BT-65]|uniref:DUF2171 domain-containing protein n=1 Tax=Sphingomonas sp. BT-65 TaxID=2989821 RepID=UPI002235B5DC|nr:DUF2171 domain-containing protein [Sphingomonas sp. BT-65]MCW4462889.1 DUF2171 domain-containing protein [Sphingomonas sp. BT-65]